MQTATYALSDLLDAAPAGLYDVVAHAAGPQGRLPLSEEMLRDWPSGDLFGLTQNAGMGWSPAEMLGPQMLILSTQGGVRAEDGKPIALGYHTGHWEVGLLVQAAARVLKDSGCVPFSAYCSDPCDGRTQGTVGMFDSLPYRNDAATIFRRQMRSLPTRRGVMGVATCDKGLPAMMMALASARELPTVLVPGGVTLPPTQGEDAGKVQSIGARFSHGEMTLEEAAEAGCRACASPGGGCQFLGTAASSQVIGEALGLSLPHSALAPSGQPIWLDMARRSAKALVALERRGLKTKDILTDASIHNAMVVHAAFGASTNLLLHLPAIAYSAGLRRPTVEDWEKVNRRVPRLVDALPNGPVGHPTVQVFLAGGVPEVMLHLRELGLLELGAMTVAGITWGEALDWWQGSPRREAVRRVLRSGSGARFQRARQAESPGTLETCPTAGVDPDNVIMSPARARERGLTSTVCFPRGNLAPEGSVIKSTAIDPRVVDADGVYRKSGPARVFTREVEAIAAIKAVGPASRAGPDAPPSAGAPGAARLAAPTVQPIQPGDIIVLMGRGPMGSGMEEIYQITSALKHLSWGREVAVITDARFSGVSTGACIGHVGPEALAGGPLGKLRDGDRVRIVVDRHRMVGSIDFIGEAEGGEQRELTSEEGAKTLAARPPHPRLSPDPRLPDDTRLWAALVRASGGTWGGCVYDVERIIAALNAGADSAASPRERR